MKHLIISSSRKEKVFCVTMVSALALLWISTGLALTLTDPVQKLVAQIVFVSLFVSVHAFFLWAIIYTMALFISWFRVTYSYSSKM